MAIEQCQEFAADYPNFLVDSRVQRGVQRHDRLFGPEILGLTGEEPLPLSDRPYRTLR
jgi:hypothetical protein